MKFAVTLLLLMTPISTGFTSDCQKQLKVAIIDTGLNLDDPRFKDHLCPYGHKDFTGQGLDDVEGHGTHVAGSIVKFADHANYCLLIYKYYTEGSTDSQRLGWELLSLEEAIKNGANIVNFSGGGGGFNETESLLIQYNPKVTFVVAAGNEHHDIDIRGNEYYPASYFFINEIVVGALDKNGKRVSSSNWGKKVKWELGENILSTIPCKNRSGLVDGCNGYMTGTSMATSVVTGKILAKTLKSCEYRK